MSPSAHQASYITKKWFGKTDKVYTYISYRKILFLLYVIPPFFFFFDGWVYFFLVQSLNIHNVLFYIWTNKAQNIGNKVERIFDFGGFFLPFFLYRLLERAMGR